MQDTPIFTNWRKSQRSGGGDNCVEVDTHSHAAQVGVRDSKNPTGPVLTFNRSSWQAFLDGIRTGHYDHDNPGQ